jgi:hypothetical protein
MTRRAADLASFNELPTGSPWRPVARRPGVPVWTDDYSNLLSVMKWDGFVNGLGTSAR